MLDLRTMDLGALVQALRDIADELESRDAFQEVMNRGD